MRGIACGESSSSLSDTVELSDSAEDVDGGINACWFSYIVSKARLGVGVICPLSIRVVRY
jgi:hypothetical protein